MDSRGQILLLDSQALQYSMRQTSVKSPPSSVAAKPHTEAIYYRQSHLYSENESNTEANIYIPQNLDPEELAYKFPAGSSTIEDIVDETTLNQQHTLSRETFIAEWDGDSDSSRVNMRDSAAKDVYVPIETDATKYKLSWASTISVGENAVAVYNPPADILPSDFSTNPLQLRLITFLLTWSKMAYRDIHQGIRT
ncbi:unnamed protein product [Umbelopsis vinacea]